MNVIKPFTAQSVTLANNVSCYTVTQACLHQTNTHDMPVCSIIRWALHGSGVTVGSGVTWSCVTSPCLALVFLIDWISDTRSQGYIALQSLLKCLDHRGIVLCSLSADTSCLVTTTSSTQRSDLLEACQTAWYNGTTSSTPELNPDGSFEDIMCVTSSGNVSYQNAQCQTGYNGLLCTNCDSGWGNSRTFHCNQCMSSVPTNTFLIFLGHLASFCYVAWLVRGSLASAAQVGKAEADHFEQFSDMMKVWAAALIPMPC